MKSVKQQIVYFFMFYTVNNHCTKIIIHMFYTIFALYQNNKNHQLKALELHINISLQNMHDIYFSYKVYH